MSEFYVPYQFVPATAGVKETTPFEKVKKGETNIRHDKWVKDALSGRIVCRLTLETPTFVGAKQQPRENENKAAFVEPYLRNGKRAIPANSLRGMISSIAETLSQSSLRVLNDHYYSVRKPVGNSLSAIGLLRANKTDSKKLELIPLTLPTLKSEDKRFFNIENKWLKVFEDRPLAECLTIYIDGYESQKYKGEETLIYKPNSFLDQEQPNSFSGLGKFAKFYAVPKPTSILYQSKVEKNINCDLKGLKSLSNRYLLGQLFSNQNELRELNSLNDQITQNEIKGFFRVLGIDGEKATTIPSSKKHELFIPLPTTKYNVLTVSDEALQRFHRMAKERSEDSEEKLPFLLKGYEDIYKDFHKNPQLQAGMVVFFDVEEQENGFPIVNELSLSANWRKEVGKNRDYFEEISPNLLPFNPKRNDVTPAELLFGFIEEGKQKDAKSSRALASRVRFSDGLLNEKVTFTEEDKIIILKILGSPKPPSPALYFGQGTYIKKTDLNPEKHRPNGRKYYLHHPQSQIKEEFWKVDPKNIEEKTLKMRLQCQPMTQAEFWFHIDFENLSNAELTLLLKSLHPSNEFRHKLGLGKSLALGSVKIDIMGVFGIDRATRYSKNALNEESRYHWGYEIKDDIKQNGFYKSECQDHNLENRFSYDESLIDKEALSILNKIGDRSVILKSEYLVHTPLTTRQKPQQDEQFKHSEQHRFESETFKWFGENDNPKTIPQTLKPIELDKELPTLNTDVQQKESLQPNQKMGRK